MKNLILVTMLCLSCSVYAGDKKISCEEREKIENKKRAGKYRKYAKDLNSYELKECYKEGDAKVLSAVKETVDIKHKLGAHLDKLADALENNDKDAIKKLHDEKWELERKVEIADKKRRVAQSIAEADSLLKKYPNSEELKKLKIQIIENCDKFIKLSEEAIELERQKIKQEQVIRTVKNKLYKSASDAKKKQCEKNSDSSKKK